jgi:4-amino-4-deoxy-L-arabinose transferase-like glycosyltransferase
MAQPVPDQSQSPRRRRLLPWLVAGAFFVAIAPTLPWLQFAGGSENLVVETVLEMRRGGPWFIPTLQGYPRLSKPPLTAWLTAAAARPETVEQLSSRDANQRQSAFRAFAWQVRWPTLLSACLTLVATYALGDLLLGRPAGLVSSIACGSTLLFMRFCRGATTDVQLALWVAAANAFLALALFRRRYWVGFLGAGAATGLALMSKGPVAFIQSTLPFGLFALWRVLARPGDTGTEVPAPAGQGRAIGLTYAAPSRRARSALLPALLLGVGVMLAVALPWPLEVWRRYPDILQAWKMEVTREGATQLAPDPWYTYLVFPVWVLPWLSFFAAGCWVACVSLARPVNASLEALRQREGFVLALMLTAVPLLVMTCVKDKNERYMLPMIVPAAVLAGGAAAAWFRSDRRDPAGRVVEALHWVTLGVMAAGVPIVGLMSPRFGLGAPWFSVPVAVAIAVAAGLVLFAGTTVVRRASASCAAAAITTALVILLLQYPILYWYRGHSVADLKPLADLVWERYPDAALYEYDPGTRTRTYLDLPIYAGRLTRKVNDPASLEQTDRPQVVVYFSKRSGGAPDLPPPWQELTSGGGHKDRWTAYVLPKK